MAKLTTQLNKLPKSALIAMINELYGCDDEVDDKIERQIELLSFQAATKDSANAGEQFANSLKQKIIQLVNDDEFIDYAQSHHYANRIYELLQDIEALAESALKQALETLEQLLDSQDAILNGVDDSNGDVGGVMSEAIALWLKLASQLRQQDPDEKNWLESVLHFFDHNDYGCFDEVISDSQALLSEAELKQLAWRFESAAKKAIKGTSDRRFDSKASHACLGLQSVAEALEDIELYEKATLIISPEPNTMQLQSLISYALRINQFERAAYWLQQPQWQQDKTRHMHLQNSLLQRQGKLGELKQNLLQAFEKNPLSHTLEDYLEFADPQEKQAISQQVFAVAATLDDKEEAIKLLLTLGETDRAADYLIQHQQALSEVRYETLLKWLKQVQTTSNRLSIAVCYRLLLTDLLERSVRKAYHHGANYFHQLLQLDRQIDDYQGLVNAQDFIRQIQQQHWRKTSFWQLANYPNKAE